MSNSYSATAQRRPGCFYRRRPHNCLSWEPLGSSHPEHYLDEEGAFDVQRITTVASVKLERKLGELMRAGMDSILDRLAERLGI